jgi:ACS family D-galactonate transporter-like MFS transporter
MSSISSPAAPPGRASSPLARLFDRQLQHYPDTRARMTYLAITVLATVVLYYELYVQGSVSTKIIQHYGFSFTQFVLVLVVGNAVGAFASLFAGLADRWGRANLVVGGLVITGLLIAFALPNASSKAEYMALFAVLSLVEGVALVATPALIRDFSPQLGRGAAMGFWTMGPVLGSLLVTEVASHTLASHPDWQFQFHVCGAFGLAVAVITVVGLRELSPRLRDQLMVSIRDRALIEARAAGVDPEKMLKHHWRQMLRLDIIGSALGISLFLLIYYVFVAFLVVFFVTNFGYTAAKADNLANWYWITNAIALLAAGLLSDRLRVRKPFMLIGAVISLAGVALLASATTGAGTGYHTFALYFILIAAGAGIAYVTWMAAFTETVEKHNPAATATGLAVWGWIIRAVVTISFAILPAVVPATSTLVNQGPKVASIVARYPAQVKVLQTVDPTTLAALTRDPSNQLAQAKAASELSGVPVASVAKVAALNATYGSELVTARAIAPATQAALVGNPSSVVAQRAAVAEIAQGLRIPPAQAAMRLQALAKVPVAELAFLRTTGPRVRAAASRLKSITTVPPADLAYLHANAAHVAAAKQASPGQWQTWWWVCFAGQLLFIPLSLLLTGRWSPRKARKDEREHEQMVQHELALLQTAHPSDSAAEPVPVAS